MALVDPLQRDLYVACTGDSRAVAGIWEENDDGTGKWRVEVLTEDQTGRNENEAKRCVQCCVQSFNVLIYVYSVYNRNTLLRM
jgi:serine/threonine protein phosphatase PrpC